MNMKFLNIQAIFFLIICPNFNAGMNNQNSSKGRPWLDLNLLPHELPELPDESLNPNPANLTDLPDNRTVLAELSTESSNPDPIDLQELPNESTNLDPNKLLELTADESAELEQSYLKIPRVDVEGNTLSQADLEIKFAEIIGRPWIRLKIIKKKYKKLCNHIWIYLSGPNRVKCFGRVIKKTAKKNFINLATLNLTQVQADTLCCVCHFYISTRYNFRDSFLVTQYSENDYFILKRPTRNSRLQVVGFLPNINVHL